MASIPRPTSGTSKPTVNKTGGGFNPTLNVSVTKTTPTSGSAHRTTGRGTPGAEFMSNEDIRAFSEHVRKEARHRAVERSMDAEQLEAVLRTIPTSDGSLAGARLRARRVSRRLKRIARAEQLIAREAAGLYATFEREYEADLMKIGKARSQPAPRAPFAWR